MDKARIAEEANHFFEWPDPKRKDFVTFTSCVIFACVIAEMARAESMEAAAALSELVRLEDLRIAIGANNTDAEDEYEEKSQGAWNTARAIVQCHKQPNSKLTGGPR